MALPTLTIIAILVLSFLSGITTLIGVVLAFYFKKSIKWITTGIGFSVGIMLAISFLEIIPEGMKAINWFYGILALILGGGLIFILNFIIPHTHFIKEKGKLGKITRVALLVAFGLIIHDFPEGFAMATSYIFAPGLGLLVAISIALHNIPEEFAMAVPLVLSKKKSFLIKLALVSALAEPAGAVIGIIIASMAPMLNPLLMIFAAGAMIFISLHELYPLAKTYKKPYWFGFGIVISLLVYFGLSFLV